MVALIESTITLRMRLDLLLLQPRRNGSFQFPSSLALSCHSFLSSPSPFTWGFPLSRQNVESKKQAKERLALASTSASCACTSPWLVPLALFTFLALLAV
jgi:hypothetical protein